MPLKTLDELIDQLTIYYREGFEADARRKTLADRQGRVMTGREKEHQALGETIKARTSDIRKLLDDWTRQAAIQNKDKESAPAQPARMPIFEPGIEVNLSIIKDVFEVGAFKRKGYVNVPLGQVYVFGHQSVNEVGSAEVYLGGEMVVTDHKDERTMIAILSRSPGEIRCTVNQWLAGISNSPDDVARISLRLPVRLYDPKSLLDNSGGAWMSKDGRKNMNESIQQQVAHQIQELLSDRLQLWSGEKTDVIKRVHQALEKRLQPWGLHLATGPTADDPSAISMVRQYPRSVYEIAVQLARAEQFVIDADNKQEIIEQSGLNSDDLMSIEASSQKKSGSNGEGLFEILRVKMRDMEKTPELRDKLVNWLRTNGGAALARFVSETIKQYASIGNDQDASLTAVNLSEQVIRHLLVSPVIGLGEHFETLE